MSRPQVSVVMPVHNGEPYIAEAIRSVMTQTYERWSLAVVDNASTDDTPSIVEQFARQDERVRLVRYEQLVDGNSNHERAYRLSAEEGDYCKVLQADDLLFESCLESLVDLAERHPDVGVAGGYRLSGNVVDLKGLPPGVEVMAGTEILRQSLTGGPYVTGSPTSLLFRAALVRQRDPFYDLSFEHTDTEAAYWAFTLSDFGLVHDVLTFTRRQGGSRTDWAGDVNSYIPENIRLILRYGDVLEPSAYRAALRRELRKYLAYHLKRRVRPWIVKPAGFRAYHLEQIERMCDESRGDRAVLAAGRLARTLVGGREAVDSEIR